VPVPPPAPVEESMSGMRIGGLVLAGLGVATCAVGALFGSKASAASSDLKSKVSAGSSYDASLQAIDADGRSAQNKEWLFLGVGGAALATGAVLFAIGGNAHTDTGIPQALVFRPILSPQHIGTSLRVSF
jgi:hypothetical protein